MRENELLLTDKSANFCGFEAPYNIPHHCYDHMETRL